MWFTSAPSGGGPGAIGRINPTTYAISLFSSGLNAGSSPNGIAAGPDGNLWFADSGTPKAIGKVTTGGEITEFSSIVPTVASYTAGSNTLTLSEAATASGTAILTFSTVATLVTTAGSDEATVSAGLANLFVGMETSGTGTPGTTITKISGSTLTLSSNAATTNLSNAVTFSTSVAGVTTSAGSPGLSVSSGGFPLVAAGDRVSGEGIPVGILNPGANPLTIAEGPDANMWFNDTGTGVTPTTPAIGMIKPSTDVVTEFTKPPGMNAGSKPQALTTGPDGNVWFTDTGTAPAIGRFGLGVCGNSLQGCNFQNADLQNIILAGADLEGSNLKNAQLENAHLIGADLQGDNLKDAQLQHYAFLDYANLKGDNLQSANLSGAELADASLHGSNLLNADLEGANLTNANLTGANLNRANLTGANLTGADLTGANLHDATLTGATWSNTTCPDGTNSSSDGGTCAHDE